MLVIHILEPILRSKGVRLGYRMRREGKIGLKISKLQDFEHPKCLNSCGSLDLMLNKLPGWIGRYLISLCKIY